jgi:hypothetical protein
MSWYLLMRVLYFVLVSIVRQFVCNVIEQILMISELFLLALKSNYSGQFLCPLTCPFPLNIFFQFNWHALI